MNAQLAARTEHTDPPASIAQTILQDLFQNRLVLTEDWEALRNEQQERILECRDPRALLNSLTELKLLTKYQAERIAAFQTFGMVLGNYRVLDRLGSGGMGVVYRGEHMELRRPVAIKVLQIQPDQDPRVLTRFRTEMRLAAQLRHPNIAGATDAGTVEGLTSDVASLSYFVMELVPGQDLEEMVRERGALPMTEACDLIFQVAAGLAEAHKHLLVHRDVKPSNVLVTPQGQAKLLDFGLARHLPTRLTEPGTVLGTVDYMSPEQVEDASNVDARADIYGLGGSLYWCLTGQLPFPSSDCVTRALLGRLTQAPPRVRAVNPEVPVDLEGVICRMMATDPEDRYPNAEAVMQALEPFLRPELRDDIESTPARGSAIASGLHPHRLATGCNRVLIVDDEAGIRRFCNLALTGEGLICEEASDGQEALEFASREPFDLVLLDIDMPRLNGIETCRRLRARPTLPHQKIIMLSGRVSPDELARLLLAGADDSLCKPFTLVQVQSRVKAALRHKEAQQRAGDLNQQLLTVNRELEKALTAQAGDVVSVRNALALALARLVESRDSETGGHLIRLSRYSRRLAEHARETNAFPGQVDEAFCNLLECCAPLHDVGKVSLPDHILLKPGKLDADERLLMQTHTVVGSDTLRAVAHQHGPAVAFLHMAADVARYHHERYDGKGYPDRLSGNDIPLAARIVAIADVYDALRSRRAWKPALSHVTTMQIMTELSRGQFDPILLKSLKACAAYFEQTFVDVSD
jgi:response regulator RpfG family c-di-GMP phosphodiesterase